MNHWVKLHQQKQQRYWTVEFIKSNKCVFMPRRIDVLNPAVSLSKAGNASIIFRSVMTNLGDHELFDFVKESKKGMSGLECYLRYYQGILNEVEYYYLNDLSYGGSNHFYNHSDLEFILNFNRLRKVKI